VVVTRPPYQFDAATPGQRIAFSQFFGQHGYLPDLVDIRTTSTCTHFRRGRTGHPQPRPAGRGTRGRPRPTLSVLMGIPGPQNARGRILYDVLNSPGSLKEITVLDISDYHGQLVPLADTADNVPGTAPRIRRSGSAGPRS
jgi:hypothetical protein